MRDRAAAAAGALRAAGVAPGDRVAAMCSNRLELLELILGCAWSGAIVVPINTASRGAQLEHVLRSSGARFLLAEAPLIERLERLDADIALERVWALDANAADADADIEVPAAVAGRPVTARPDHTGDLLPAHGVQPGDTAAILYTSGTTGPSKGVCCPQAQLYWWGVLVSESLGIEQGDVLYTCLPLFHTNEWPTRRPHRSRCGRNCRSLRRRTAWPGRAPPQAGGPGRARRPRAPRSARAAHA